MEYLRSDWFVELELKWSESFGFFFGLHCCDFGEVSEIKMIDE